MLALMVEVSRHKALTSAVLVVVLTAMTSAQGLAGSADASSEIETYCTNIAVAASDARFAWQTGKLNQLEARIKARIQELDSKAAELRGWIEKREALEKKAGEKLAGIYAKMRPETAATQIASLDDDMAAAVLGQLNARQASAIFNEIVPERAAKLAGMIAGIVPSSEKKL